MVQIAITSLAEFKTEINAVKFLQLCSLWLLLLVGCVQPNTGVPPSPQPFPTVVLPPTPSVPPPPTTIPTPWTDEIPTMYGVCFEAADARKNQTIVIRSAGEHVAFYDTIDANGECRRAVNRAPFDFADGRRVLAGVWTDGIGCTARHDVLSYTVVEGTLTLALAFITEGDCPYALLRPFWIGVDGVQNVVFQVTTVTSDE
ncbi:MAG: hypothetical protein ACOYL5_02800 [Phototrophicaceae bacterium]